MKDNKEVFQKKGLKEFKQTNPEQLELFQIDAYDIQNREDYSHAVEIYDIMPKYHFGSQKRIKSKELEGLPNLNREFKNNDTMYKLVIAPASLNDDRTGKTIHHYPSQREELVEDAIRRLATQKQGIFLDDEAAAKFTLYEVAQELKRMGHGYSIQQIKEAIDVCNNVRIQITAKNGNEISATTAIFPFVAMETKKDGAEKNRVVVMFHPLVTKSIKNGTYRLINYRKAMSYKMALSRWIHKRMSYNFTQASPKIPYPLLMSTIIRDSGMKSYSKASENIRQICKSLDEMKKLDVLSEYQIEKRMKGRRIEEALFTLYVSESFKKDAKKASKIANAQLIENIDVELDKLRKEMEKSCYGLSKTLINNYLTKINTSEKLKTIKLALAAAKEYIEKKPDCISAAITKTAISEGWKPKFNSELNKENKETSYISESDQKNTKETLEEIEYLKSQKWWKEFEKVIKSEFEEEAYKRWLSNLSPFSKTKSEIILSVPSKFLRDWIIREYLGSGSKKDRGLRDILKDQNSEITKVAVIFSEVLAN